LGGRDGNGEAIDCERTQESDDALAYRVLKGRGCFEDDEAGAGGEAGNRIGSAQEGGDDRGTAEPHRELQGGGVGCVEERPQTPDGVMESVKHAGASALRAANRASGPTVTVAAAVAGIAGGLLLRQRPKPALHDGLGARSKELLHDIDPSSVIEGLGRASMLVSRRSKSLARDIDQVADRAERLSKVLR
jgi:hypothetical protein